MPPVELKKIWWYRAKMYKTFELVGTGDKIRIINAPNDRLKFFQRQLVELLEPLYLVRNPVHGFVAERSVKTNALSHLRRRFILNIDFQDFLWTNRLIGDAQPGAVKTTFTTFPTYRADAPLPPSGLIGPVALIPAR